MQRRIRRRDFVNGTATALAGAAVGAGHPLQALGGLASTDAAQLPQAEYYPPALTGMRGSGYPSAYSTGHALRDGNFWPTAPQATQTADQYDLIVVGGGISGLAAAYFFQKQHGFTKRVLVLD